MKEESRTGVHRSLRLGGAALAVSVAALMTACAAPPIVSPAATADGDRELYERAHRILREAPLIDGHNDLPWQYRKRCGNHLEQLDIAADLTTLENPTHTDIPRLRAGGLGGQFWSVYIPIRKYPGQAGDARAVLEQIDLVHRMAARYPEHFEMAYTADDVERIHQSGRIACMIGMEGGHAIENSLAVLRMLYDVGARYMTITHSKSTLWADSATDERRHGGLTKFGKEVIREMNRLGMLIDLSHVSPETMHHALDVSQAPVIFSHSSAYSVCAHVRNVPDDVLKRLEPNGGVVMVTFFPAYVSDGRRHWRTRLDAERERLKALYPEDEGPRQVEAELAAWREANPSPRPTVQQVADHIDHIRRVAGIDAIGIGSDYDGMPPGPVGLEDVSCYPNLVVELLRRGYRDQEIKKIIGLNVLRAMREAERVAARLQQSRPPSDVTREELDGEVSDE